MPYRVKSPSAFPMPSFDRSVLTCLYILGHLRWNGSRGLAFAVLVMILAVRIAFHPGDASAQGLDSTTYVSSAPALQTPGQPVIQLEPETLPDAAHRTLEALNVRDADLRDVFRSIAAEHGLNLAVDNRIERQVTIRLADLPVIDVIVFLCEQYELSLIQDGGILRIEQPEPLILPPPPPREISVSFLNGVLSADLSGESLSDVVRAIAEASGQNIVVRQGVEGPVRGLLTAVPLAAGLKTLMETNGFSVRERDGIYHIDRSGVSPPADGQAQGQSFWVEATDSTVSFEVTNAPIADILREVSVQSQMNLITYKQPEGQITARVSGVTPEEALTVLFRGTGITFRKAGDVYYVGDKATTGIATTRLIRLDHLRADGVPDLLPAFLLEQATVQVVREHNGIMVTGTQDVVEEIELFIDEIDYPTPQILIEALVVDFERTNLNELGIQFGRGVEDSDEGDSFFAFGEDGLEAEGYGSTANRYEGFLDPLTDLFGIRQIGRLPDDFYIKIQALAAEGLADIRSRPQISTLNGHPASLSIGTTQYYILKSETPILSSPSQVIVQETERFEKIEANVSLEIIPWVSASGEVTTEIRPEFSTPVGSFDPAVPPTINTRVLESTVRLRDGETIILGGLIQDSEIVNHNKIPILGSIPLLGRLFRSTSKNKRKSELVIYLTPHVFYGDERDDEKWNRLREEQGLLDPGEERGMRIGTTELAP
jgi:type IV pilus assembly protein PilQ